MSRDVTKSVGLDVLFAETSPRFQGQVRATADEFGKPHLTVFAWWREYGEQCRNFDQSALWSEFLAWYGERLKSPN